MLAIADQTAQPKWLTFFEGTHEYPCGNINHKNRFFLSKFDFFNSTGNTRHLASIL